MWIYTHSKTVLHLTAEQLWKTWTDVNNWHEWQDDIEFAKITGSFEPGNIIHFRPKGGPNVKIKLLSVDPQKSFVDITSFFLARMIDSHEISKTESGVEIKTTLTMQGPLAFLWRKLVAEGIAKSLDQQTSKLIEQTEKNCK